MIPLKSVCVAVCVLKVCVLLWWLLPKGCAPVCVNLSWICCQKVFSECRFWSRDKKNFGTWRKFLHELQPDSFANVVPLPSHSLNYPTEGGRGPSLCIAVIGATGELAKGEIFLALFALYYNGFLSEDVGIFGYSRKNLTAEDLRSIIALTLTCRIDHQQNCGDKWRLSLAEFTVLMEVMIAERGCQS